MSAHNHSVRLTLQAQLDYDDILLFTLTTFGEVQMLAYQADLDAAFARLRKFPESGVAREDIDAGIRALIVREHSIFYSVADDEVVDQRVLHSRHDVDWSRIVQ